MIVRQCHCRAVILLCEIRTKKKKKTDKSFFTNELTCPIFFFFSRKVFFFFLTRPEHCWPFISSSYQASLPNVRCSLPKFDSKILIALNALQRDSNMRSPRTPAYGPFQWFLFRMVPALRAEAKHPAPPKSGTTYRSRDLKKKKMQKKAKKLLFSAES